MAAISVGGLQGKVDRPAAGRHLGAPPPGAIPSARGPRLSTPFFGSVLCTCCDSDSIVGFDCARVSYLYHLRFLYHAQYEQCLQEGLIHDNSACHFFLSFFLSFFLFLSSFFQNILFLFSSLLYLFNFLSTYSESFSLRFLFSSLCFALLLSSLEKGRSRVTMDEKTLGRRASS